ncbi:hypothetical protein KIN20_000433 [Parelaphostrongylus tenuis]|uniref:Uncharacterized protein n=1 Tax=Parelaphostrongylus tenuis TaxID=148309 RepID=A0AAD5MD96_PARTN|nr:hypothetical protein KIN20_000433 [Parelaphostrongylus tenuis]
MSHFDDSSTENQDVKKVILVQVQTNFIKRSTEKGVVTEDYEFVVGGLKNCVSK